MLPFFTTLGIGAVAHVPAGEAEKLAVALQHGGSTEIARRTLLRGRWQPVPAPPRSLLDRFHARFLHSHGSSAEWGPGSSTSPTFPIRRP